MSLIIKNLSAKITANNKDILQGVNLEIGDNEVHFILGPNGSGKSTLAKCILADNSYQVTAEELAYNNIDLLKLPSYKISNLGIFLSFQQPVEIDGVSNIQFLKTILNEKNKANNIPTVDTLELLTTAKKYIKILGLSEDFLTRPVNKNFSGGEKKKNEILQMLLLEPSLIILDEIDSGVDIDALKTIFEVINEYKKTHTCSFLIITHHMKLANLIQIDKFHIIKNGKLILTENDRDKIFSIEQNGFKDF